MLVVGFPWGDAEGGHELVWSGQTHSTSNITGHVVPHAEVVWCSRALFVQIIRCRKTGTSSIYFLKLLQPHEILFYFIFNKWIYDSCLALLCLYGFFPSINLLELDQSKWCSVGAQRCLQHHTRLLGTHLVVLVAFLMLGLLLSYRTWSLEMKGFQELNDSSELACLTGTHPFSNREKASGV